MSTAQRLDKCKELVLDKIDIEEEGILNNIFTYIVKRYMKEKRARLLYPHVGLSVQHFQRKISIIITVNTFLSLTVLYCKHPFIIVLYAIDCPLHCTSHLYSTVTHHLFSSVNVQCTGRLFICLCMQDNLAAYNIYAAKLSCLLCICVASVS